MDAYFGLSKDPVTSIVLGYLKLVPIVRQKLEDTESIETLFSTLTYLEKAFGEGSTHKSTRDVLTAVEEVKASLKDK